MKEFVEKLIDRLGEKIFKAELYNDEFDGRTVDNLICFGDVADTIKDLASEHNNGWIPCSERLPEPGKRYLVSGVWKDEDFEKHSVYDAVYGTDGIWHTYEYKPTMYDVIAWQPLPAPYRKGGMKHEQK